MKAFGNKRPCAFILMGIGRAAFESPYFTAYAKERTASDKMDCCVVMSRLTTNYAGSKLVANGLSRAVLRQVARSVERRNSRLFASFRLPCSYCDLYPVGSARKMLRLWESSLQTSVELFRCTPSQRRWWARQERRRRWSRGSSVRLRNHY